jgi:hypothetical protein
VGRVKIRPSRADIRIRLKGLAGLVHDVGAIAPEALKAAA